VATGTALPFPLWRRDSSLLASQSAQRNNSERLSWFQDGPERLVSLASLVVRNPNSGTGLLCRGSPCDNKGKGDVDESFDEAAAASFRAHHQRRGVRHHDRDPAPRIEVRPGLLSCNRIKKNCFSGSECGGRSAKHVNCRKAMR
jgi:hypothetical protein